VLFSVSIPKSQTTRALNATDENTIASVNVLAFRYDAANDVYYYAYHSTGRITTSGNRNPTYAVMAHILPEQQQFVVIANAAAEVNSLVSLLSATETRITKNRLLKRLQIDLTDNGGKWNTGDEAHPFTPLPMWGESLPVTVDAHTGNISDTPLPLLRMVARIDVALTTDQPEKTVDKFRLKEVYLYNYQARGCIVPAADAYNRNEQRVLTPTLPADGNDNAYKPVSTPVRFDRTDPQERAIQGEIYAFETAATDERNQSTCLVVGGTYSPDGNFDEAANTYYRVDFRDMQTGDPIDLLRNHHYIINITEVMGEGYETPETAFAAQSVNLTAEVLQWNQPHMDYVVFDGTSVLGISSDNFEFYRNEERKEIEAGNVLYVYTDFRSNDPAVPSGWYVKSVCDGNGKTYADFNDCWLKLHDDQHELLSIGADRGNKAVYAPGENRQLHLTFGAIDEAEVNGRSVVITFAAGRLEYPVTVTQREDYICDIRLHYSNAGEPDKLYELANGSMLTFVANTGIRPAAKTIVMDIIPRERNVELSWSSVGTTVHNLVSPENGFTEELGWKHNLKADPETGKAKLILSPEPLTEEERANGRISVVTLQLEFDSKVVTRIFTLRQMEYMGDLSDPEPLYLMDDDSYELTLKTNVSWQAEVIDDPCDILTLKNTRGAANMKPGNRVAFGFKDFAQSYRNHKEAYKRYQESKTWTPDKGMASATIAFFHTNEANERIDLGYRTVYATPLTVSKAQVGVAARTADPNNPTPCLSEPVTVRGRSGTTWLPWHDLSCSASTERTKNGKIYLHNHHVQLVAGGGTTVIAAHPELTYNTASPAAYIPTGTPQPCNSAFRFSFDPVQFPNRLIPDIASHVRFYIPVDGENVWVPNATVTAAQEMLTPRPSVVWARGNGIYGCLWQGITDRVRQYLFLRMGVASGKGYPGEGNNGAGDNDRFWYTGTAALSNAAWNPVTYIHYGYGNDNTPPDADAMQSARNGGDVPIWLLGISPSNTALNYAQTALNTVSPGGGYVLAGGISSGANSGLIKPSYQPEDQKTLIYKFVMGDYPGAANALSNGDFSSGGLDGTSTRLTSFPPTAVPLIRYNNAANEVLLSIDPVNNVIYSGEDQMYDGMGYPGISNNLTGRDKFFNNLIDYIVQSAGYGKLFTKLLTGDEETAGYLWDATTWGANVYPN
jgi:hypothetical protein